MSHALATVLRDGRRPSAIRNFPPLRASASALPEATSPSNHRDTEGTELHGEKV